MPTKAEIVPYDPSVFGSSTDAKIVPYDPSVFTKSNKEPVNYPPEQPAAPQPDVNDVIRRFTDPRAQRENLQSITPSAEQVGDNLPTTAGIVGSAAGIPGTIAGILGGEIAHQNLQKYFPNKFGAPPEGAGDSAWRFVKELGVNLGTDLVGKGLGKILEGPVNEFKARIAKAFINKELDPDVVKYLQLHPNFNLPVSQVGGNTVARGMEDILQHSRKTKMLQDLQDQFAHEWSQLVPSRNPEELSGIIKTGIQEGRDSARGIAKSLYDKVAQNAESETVRIPGATKQEATGIFDSRGKMTYKTVSEPDITVKGPVYINDARDLAQNYLNQLKEQYGKKSSEELEAVFAQNPGGQQLITNLDRLARTDPKIPIDLKTATDIKAVFGDKANFNNVFKNSTEGTYSRLNHAVDNDIESSLAKFQTAPNALQDYQAAKSHYSDLMAIYKDNPTNAALLDTKLSGKAEVDRILKDPVSIRAAIKASKDPAVAQDALRQRFLSDFMPENLAIPKAGYDNTAALTKWQNPENQPQIKALFTPAQQQGMTEFFKTFAAIDPKASFAGVSSTSYRASKAAFYLAGSIVPFLTGTGHLASADAGLVTVVLAGSSFAKRILMNPDAARLAAGLAKLPPTSQAAQEMSKLLFATLKGAQVVIQSHNGATLGTGTVNKDGKVQADHIPGQPTDLSRPIQIQQP